MKYIKNVVVSKIFRLFWIFNFIGIFVTLLALSISKRYDLLGWTNAVTFGTAILFALLWLVYANSKGVFDMMIFGVKSFWKAFKKTYEKEDYLAYVNSKDKTSTDVYIAISLSFAIYLIATIVLFIVLKS